MITEEQRQRRKGFLGSSDAAAVFDLDPFRDKTSVYWDKVADMPDDGPTASMRAGNLLEGAILDYAAQELGVEIERDIEIAPPADLPYMGANLDGRVDGKTHEGVEAKYDTFTVDQWGDEGTDQVPERVIVQVHHQMAVAALDRVWVPVLKPRGFGLYVVDRSEELISQVIEGERKFWDEHVLAELPPSGDPTPPLAYLKARNREPESIVDLDEAALEAWRELEERRATAKAAKEDVDAAQARVIDLLGDAEGGRLPSGDLITFLEQKSAPSCDSKRLRALHPDVYREFFRQGTHRRLRLKAAKRAAA